MEDQNTNDKLKPIFKYNQSTIDMDPTWTVTLAKEDDKYKVTVEYSNVSGGHATKYVNTPEEIGNTLTDVINEMLTWM